MVVRLALARDEDKVRSDESRDAEVVLRIGMQGLDDPGQCSAAGVTN